MWRRAKTKALGRHPRRFHGRQATFRRRDRKLIRAGTIDKEAALSYATNPGNLRLAIADLSQDSQSDTRPAKPVAPDQAAGKTEVESER
jgi:hypothetical protein